jgi:hypothetical protein
MKFNVEITLNNSAQVQLRSGLYAEAELPIKNKENLIISKRCIVGSMESRLYTLSKMAKQFAAS